jgi:hypothetical protein
VLEGIAMTQLTAKRGLARFGNAGTEAMLKELKQLNDRDVLDPKSDLTKDEKNKALEYLMFLKEKKNGSIKGRGCADGRKQRETTTKEEASAPTVAIESVATVDIPGAFMHADMDEIVHVRLRGKMAELIAALDPKLYRKHIQTVKGKPVLYAKLRKALYGTLRAALLFWQLLSKTLVSWGFVINPYDCCVANKTINGKQCTICWHVDDLKISHMSPNVVTSVIEQLDEAFGKEAPLTITRGKIHEYLGMTLDYSEAGKVKIYMVEYIMRMLENLPEDMDGIAATPAAKHLFEVNENPDLLTEERAQFFHHNVAKLLFLCKRARPDTQTAVAFMSTRVKTPDQDDYKKLARTMRYLRSTVDLPLTLEADDLTTIKWWVDGAFAVHPDMKSHTGGTMTLGQGSVYSASTRQKLNTKSSTETEVVATADILPQAIWTRYFMNAQGHQITDNLMTQDNLSAKLLENNGRGSSSKRTRHINIRYFFITDRIKAGEVRVAYCPTEEMVADFFTKALQGSLFKKFRDLIMNIKAHPTDAHPSDRRSVLGIRNRVKSPKSDPETPGTENVPEASGSAKLHGKTPGVQLVTAPGHIKTPKAVRLNAPKAVWLNATQAMKSGIKSSKNRIRGNEISKSGNHVTRREDKEKVILSRTRG